MYGYLLLLILAAEVSLVGGVTTRSNSTTLSPSVTTASPSLSDDATSTATFSRVVLSRTVSVSLSETLTETATTTMDARNASARGKTRTATFPTLSLSPRTTTVTATATNGSGVPLPPPPPPSSPANGTCPRCAHTASYSLTLSASPSLSMSTTVIGRKDRTRPFDENATQTMISSTQTPRSPSHSRGFVPSPHLVSTRSSSRRVSVSALQPAETRRIPVNHSAAVSPDRPHASSLSPTLSPPPALSLSRTMENNGTAAPNGTTTGAPTTTASPAGPNGTTLAPTDVPTPHPAHQTLTRTVTVEHAEAGPSGAGAAATDSGFFGSGAGETIVAVAGAAVIVLAVVLGMLAYRRWRRRRRSGDAAEPLVAPLRERTKTYRWYEDAEAVAQDIERRGDDSRLNAVETGYVPLVVATAPAGASSSVAGAITDPFAPVATEGFLGGDFSAPRRPDGATRHVPRNPMVSAFDAMMMEELDDDSL